MVSPDPLEGFDLQLPSIADRVKNILKETILDGKLKPGDKFPSEDRLAQRFHVSNTAVREALGKLAAEGLIEKRRGATGGSFVAGGDSKRILEVVVECYRLGGLTLEEVIEFRRVMEPVVLELACHRRTPKDLEAMESNIEISRRALQDGRIDRERQTDFHRLIAAATHNRMIVSSMNAAIKISREFTSRISIALDDGKVDFKSNEKFLDCLKQRKKRRARALMDDHFEKSRWVHTLSAMRQEQEKER